MTEIEKKKFDNLSVEIHPNRLSAGIEAGQKAAKELKRILEQKGRARMVFAAAPSQDEALEELVADPEIDWSKVVAFHMDEYVGLTIDAPQRFSHYLKIHLFDKISIGEVNLITGDDPEQVCKEYAQKLGEGSIDIVCMGVGENGHIAFNDPSVADFQDTKTIKVVQLDDTCRQQQVNDGCFPDLDSVPEQAITLTVPALLSGACLICTVPGRRKGRAIRQMLFGDISTTCPASILRSHKNCTLYVDFDCWSAGTEE